MFSKNIKWDDLAYLLPFDALKKSIELKQVKVTHWSNSVAQAHEI